MLFMKAQKIKFNENIKRNGKNENNQQPKRA